MQAKYFEPCKKLQKLSNLALDRNRLTEIPEDIGACEQLRVLHLRLNNISLLPESLSECASLTVLDVAENNLLFLPGGLRNLPLKAIWLSENQNQPLVQFHQEEIMFQGQARKVLMCYMLPQKQTTEETRLRRSMIDSDDGYGNLLRRSTSVRASVAFEEPLLVSFFVKNSECKK